VAGLVRKPSSRRGEVGALRKWSARKEAARRGATRCKTVLRCFLTRVEGGFSRVFVGNSFFSEKTSKTAKCAGSPERFWALWAQIASGQRKEMGENRVFGSKSKN